MDIFKESDIEVSCARTSAGVALTEEDMRYCSELISKIIAEEMDKILAAFEVIGEAFSTAFLAASPTSITSPIWK